MTRRSGVQAFGHSRVPALLIAMVLIGTRGAFAQQQPPPTGGAGQTQATPAPGATGAGQTAQPPPPGRTVTVIVPDEGEHYVRILPSADAKEMAFLPKGFKDKSTSITIPDTAGKTAKIAVDSVKTGNTAVMPLPKGDNLELHSLDYHYVRRLEVSVTYEGKRVQVAQVTLKTAEKSASKMLDTSSTGPAVFEDVPAGKAQITVVYGDKLTQTQDVEVSSDHPGGFVTVNVPVTNKVPTMEAVSSAGAAPTGPGAVSPPAGTTQTAPPSTPQPESGGGFVGLIGTLLSLAIAGGVIYLLYRWAQSGGMAATLKKAGIEVSGPPPASDAGTPWSPNAPPPPVVSDPSICAFCGQKKDAAGNCACTLSGTAGSPGIGSGAGVAGAGIPSQPRLVATMGVYSGSIFPLSANGSGITVGREATNTISLANDTTVSRRHAAIRLESGAFIVSDEGSSNGVFVNGVRISGSQPLNPGDEVQIGNTRFRFEL